MLLFVMMSRRVDRRWRARARAARHSITQVSTWHRSCFYPWIQALAQPGASDRYASAHTLLPRYPARHSERSSTMGANEERMKGKAEEIKGHVKHGVGSAFGNEQMEAEGHAEEA